MIQADGLTKYYAQHPAIVDVSFQVEQGEIVTVRLGQLEQPPPP